jgi:hypothetical protein
MVQELEVLFSGDSTARENVIHHFSRSHGVCAVLDNKKVRLTAYLNTSWESLLLDAYTASTWDGMSEVQIVLRNREETE